MRLFLAALLCSFAAAGAPGHVGLYPLSLPDGQEQLGDRLAAQLHEGAAALPGVLAFDLVAHSSCAPDEAACLALAARRAGLDSMISAQVTAASAGYRYVLRQVAADGKLLAERRGDVRGGPLDLAGALEHGVCEALGAAPCEGELRVAASEQRSLAPPEEVNGVHLMVDGADRGPLPASVRLPVGRHAVKLGEAERRVRVSYGRTVQLTAALRAGSLALLDGPEAPVAAPIAALSAAPPASQPRAAASKALFVGGAALLATAGIIGLSTGSTASSGTTGYVAAALAATGAGSLVAGGLLLALTPTGAAIHGEF